MTRWKLVLETAGECCDFGVFARLFAEQSYCRSFEMFIPEV